MYKKYCVQLASTTHVVIKLIILYLLILYCRVSRGYSIRLFCKN